MLYGCVCASKIKAYNCMETGDAVSVQKEKGKLTPMVRNLEVWTKSYEGILCAYLKTFLYVQYYFKQMVYKSLKNPLHISKDVITTPRIRHCSETLSLSCFLGKTKPSVFQNALQVNTRSQKNGLPSSYF